LSALQERITEWLRAPEGGSACALTRWETGADLLLESARAGGEGADRLRDAVDEARIAAIAEGDRPGLLEWCEGRHGQLEGVLSRAERKTDGAGPLLSREVLDEARWIRLLLSRSGRGRSDVALAETEREAVSLAEGLERGGAEDAGHGAAPVQIRLLRHRLDVLLRAAGNGGDDEDRVACVSVADVLVDESARLAAAFPDREDARDLARAAEEAEESLRGRLEDEMRTADPERAASLGQSLAELASETADEARVLASELPPGQARRALRHARRRVERVLTLWDELPGKPKRPKRVHRLRRVRRRLRAEEQELGLQGRLERIFGRRTVAFSENLILLLILLVVGLLVYESIAHPPPHVLRTLIWIDVGICGVFLTEILVRLILVPGDRLRWFLRHLPFDILPSIPFSLIELATLDVARAGRLARFFRLNRLARYVRVIRPFVRLFRVLAFLLRGLDRLVHRNTRVLNRDVLLFTPAPQAGAAEAEALAAVPAALERRALHLLRVQLDEREDEVREAGLREALDRTHRFVDAASRALVDVESREPAARSRGTAIRIEDLIRAMTGATPTSVERRLGVDLTRRVAEKLRWLDLPLLRRFPLIRGFAPGAKGLPPGELVARTARAVGGAIRRSYDRVLAISDLSGMISGPQLLDRVGGALARGAGRPARRLLLFGGGFLVLHALVNLLGFAGLKSILDLLQKYIGTPVLILGAVCVVLLVLGIWFRRIAGEATDFLERTAEAQYLNLLKIVKYRNLERDLALLQERVLEPERLLAGGAPHDEEKVLADARRFAAEVRRVLGGQEIEGDGAPARGLELARRLRVLGLVHDYLDGATLHRSDRKTTEQLLSNLSLMNLWQRRLRLDRQHKKRLRRLDLSRDQGLGGPYLWFNFITRTIAQRTAEIILEYNRHACPLADRDRLSEAEREAHDRWVEARRSGLPGQAAEDTLFRTSFFTALNVLTPGPRVDEAVRETFGPEVLAALKADRRRMIREVFGTYPLHRLPRRRRTLNPYELYRKYVSGFRIFLLPLMLVLVYLQGAFAFVRRLGSIVQEVRHPERASQARARGVAGFDVAMRKVARMRGPVFRECAWLRALFDVEYLDLIVPELSGRSSLDGYEADFEELPGAVHDRERFLRLRDERRRDLRALRRILRRKGVSADDVSPLLDKPVADDVLRARILRAVTAGFAVDDRDCRSLLVAEERIEEAFGELLADPLTQPRRPLVLRGLDLLRRLAGRMHEPLDPLPRALERYLEAHPRELTWGERRRLLRAARGDHRGIRPLLRLAGSVEHVGKCEEHAWDRIRHVSWDHERLDEELITLRTVQTLAVLDVRQYRNLIHRLGEY
jgi:hypothetical protein